MLVREAHRGDVGEIAELWRQLVDYHRSLDDALPEAAEDGMQRYAYYVYDRLLDEDTTAYVLVADDGRVVGYVLGFLVDLVPEVFLQERSGLIADVFVEATHRGRGYGRALVRAALAWFQKRGVRRVEWHVAAENTAGRAFWQAIQGRELMVRMTIDLEGHNGD